MRGADVIGGERPLEQQELASPWDIALVPGGSSATFVIAMAGTH